MEKQGVYFLQSEKNLRYYVGSTIDLEKRLTEHGLGLVKATKNLRPLKLVFFQPYDNIAHARRIEYKIKKLKRKDITEKIIRDGKIKMGL